MIVAIILCNYNTRMIMNKNRVILTSAALVALFAFSGCASTAENMRAQGYGPDYSQGYGDGCDSGRKAGGSMFDQFKKDVRRYDSNHKYKEGWDDGYKECRSEEKQMMKNINEASREQAIRDSGKYRY